MLKVLRDNLKSLSWILWLVILVFILLVFVDFGGTVPNRGGLSDVAVEIGNRSTITYGEFRQELRTTEQRYRGMFGDNFNDDLARQLGIPSQALNSLISTRILELEAEDMGLAATDAELQEAILGIGSLVDDQGRFIGTEEYERILRSNGMTVESFEAGLRQGIVTDKLRSILLDNVYVSDGEIEDSYRDEVERAKIEFVEFLPSEFEDVDAEPAEIQSYYDENREDFRLPERRSVRYLLVDREEVAASMELSEEELRAAYSTNAADYAREEQVRARHILLRKSGDRTIEQAMTELDAIRERIAGGEDFETLAKELSEDPGSGSRGGDLGFFARGAMVKPFEDASFGGQPGDLVGPIETGFGAHLIEVLERRPGGQMPFEEVRDQLESRVASERAASTAESRAVELAERLRSEGALGEAELGQIADEVAAVELVTTLPFGRDDSIENVGRAQPFSVAAFELQEGAVSDPVETRNGWAVLTLAEALPPAVQALDEVEVEVRELVISDKQLAAAAEKASNERARLDGGESLADVAESLGLKVEETPLFGRTGAVGRLGVDRALNKAALELDVDGIGGPFELADSVVLFRVTERQRFEAAEFAEQKSVTRDRLVQQKASRVLGSLIEMRREELGVRIDPQLTRDLNPDDAEAGG